MEHLPNLYYTVCEIENVIKKILFIHLYLLSNNINLQYSQYLLLYRCVFSILASRICKYNRKDAEIPRKKIGAYLISESVKSMMSIVYVLNLTCYAIKVNPF